MFPCKQCSTPNSLDSTFCKHCGETLPDTELAEAKAKLDALIGEGDTLFSQGRTEEAMLIAESAVAANPSSARALSLKGMCHERMGHIAEALDCFEKVVATSPDSALDKLKVNQLRNLLVAGPPMPPINRKTAALIAASAGTLVVAVALIAASAMARPKDSTVVAKNDKPVTEVGAPVQQPTTAQSQTAPSATAQDSAKSSANVIQDPQSAPVAGPVGTLPITGVGTNPISIEPIGGPTASKSKPPVEDPPPKVGDEHSDQVKVATGPESHPVVEISLTHPGSKLAGGGIDTTGANEVEVLVRTARSNFQLGRFDSAIHSYQRALRAGADPGPVNQRLGQCFEKLGKAPEAIAAYSRAIAAFESSIHSGVAGDETQSALESCKLAMKLLQGN